MEQTDAIPVRTLFARTIETLASLVEKRPTKERAAIRKAIATLRATQGHAEAAQSESQIASSLDALDAQPRLAAGIVEPESHSKAVLRAWGADLEQRRRAAGLSRVVLAQRAGISESTLRNVEKGRRPPTRTTLMHLQSVPELRIDPTPIGEHLAGRPKHVQEFAPNCWLAPEFDALKLHREMTMLLNGRGGHIEQTFLYLDHHSAAAWCAFAEQESYARVRSAMQLDQVAERIVDAVGNVGLDVIGLGSGDGRDEVRLTQCLLERAPNRNLRLYLLDISQPLCSAAYRHAAEVLGDERSVSVYAIQGNFYNLQRYTSLLHAPARSHRRRVICMFGNTFANLQNEILFVRSSLVGFAPGDLLLLTAPATMAPASEPQKILALDPRLSGRVNSGMGLSRHDEQLVNVLRRHISSVKSVDLNAVLDLDACTVPGSYAADVRATVKTVGGETKQFSVYYSKRYDREQLDCKMCKEGWAPVASWRFAEDQHPRLLLLYQRTRPSCDDE